MILIPEQLLVNLAVWYAAGYQYRLEFNAEKWRNVLRDRR